LEEEMQYSYLVVFVIFGILKGLLPKTKVTIFEILVGSFFIFFLFTLIYAFEHKPIDIWMYITPAIYKVADLITLKLRGKI